VLILNILLVDDHYLFADALALTMQANVPDCRVKHESSPQQLLTDPSRVTDYDMVIVDIAMPEMRGTTLLTVLTPVLTGTKVVVCSGSLDLNTVNQLSSLRVDAVIDKSEPVDVLIKVVRKVLDGASYFSDSYLALTAAMVSPASPQQLSQQQTVILNLLEQGKTNKEMAKHLNVSPNTIKTHLRHLYQKLDVSNRTGCLQKARLLHLL
jgi:DNA-binding NarL/FixJ family response regulator